MAHDRYDTIIIGGGFFGCTTALCINSLRQRVLLIEKESDLMQRASYVNQARIHQGYHYPRSILTALRSRINFPRFIDEYAECVDSSFQKYYAIGRISSKVNAAQFRLFCRRIGAPLRRAPKAVEALFNRSLVEGVFQVREYAFDTVKLRDLVRRALVESDVELMFGTRVIRAEPDSNGVVLECEHGGRSDRLSASRVFNCTYSQINQVLAASGLETIRLKHEYTEMALLEMPDELRNLGITVMDGPFFSTMPFPPRKLHTLSHVRYTPHHHWHDGRDARYLDADEHFRRVRPRSHHVYMIKDAQRYVPALAGCRYVESMWEIKTVLPQSEVDDSRPILFRPCPAIPNLISIMGGKIDNVFDVQDRIKLLCNGEARTL